MFEARVFRLVGGCEELFCYEVEVRCGYPEPERLILD